jgi:excisionase family DNA binding protein
MDLHIGSKKTVRKAASKMLKEKLALSPREAAAVIGCGMNTIYSLIHADGFPALWLSPRKVVVPRDRLEMWIDERAGKGVAA